LVPLSQLYAGLTAGITESGSAVLLPLGSSPSLLLSQPDADACDFIIVDEKNSGIFECCQGLRRFGLWT
jgi:hypothetical protein